MAQGDPSDMLSRQLSLYPQGWAEEAGGTSNVGGTAGTSDSPHPILDAILSGFASLWSWAFSLLTYVGQQMRVPTSTDGFLELAALDYYGAGQFPRLTGEVDIDYATRIQDNLLPIGSTREDISEAIMALTGEAPLIVEPWCPADTGVSWNHPVAAGAAGGAMYYSNISVKVPGRFAGRSHALAYQCWIDTITPPVPGGSGGFGYFGKTAFFDAATYYDDGQPQLLGQDDVLDTIVKLKAEGTLIWVRFDAP